MLKHSVVNEENRVKYKNVLEIFQMNDTSLLRSNTYQKFNSSKFKSKKVFFITLIHSRLTILPSVLTWFQLSLVICYISDALFPTKVWGELNKLFNLRNHYRDTIVSEIRLMKDVFKTSMVVLYKQASRCALFVVHFFSIFWYTCSVYNLRSIVPSTAMK